MVQNKKNRPLHQLTYSKVSTEAQNRRQCQSVSHK